MRQTNNSATITGLLSEMNLERASYKKKTTNQNVECIRGTVTVRANIEIDHKPVISEIPVSFFVNKYTKQNQLDGRYDALDRFIDKAKSIAMVGEAEADVVSIYVKQDAVSEHSYYAQNGALVSYPRVNGTFINIRPREYLAKECAEFEITTFIKNIAPELNAEGDETGRLKITGVIGKWNETAEILEFYTANQSVSNGFSGLYKVGDTAPLHGKFNFTTTIEEIKEEMAFGDAKTKVRTTHVSELIISGGENPLEADFAISIDEAKEGCAQREIRMEEQKKLNAAGTVKKATPFANATIDDLGF